jgi:hypothetical protein
MNEDEAYLKTLSVSERERVDRDTGEILDKTLNKITYLANSKEQFYLMYSSMVLILKKSSDSRMQMFASLLERYGRGQEFYLGNTLKSIISKETKCSPRTLERAFTSLIKDNIIVKVGLRCYRINPRHIFKGSRKNRNKALKAIIELGCKDC